MALSDQDMRTTAMKNPDQWDDSVDQRNTARLKKIVEEIGWPTIPKVGAEASQSAWLLVQHATANQEFMRKCLEFMKSASQGDVAPANIAFLEDRLLTMVDEPQIYGTQFRMVNGLIEAFPIRDPEYVDERRASMGLATFAENKARILEMYGSDASTSHIP